MSRIVKTLRTLRNNWKKTTFAAAVFAYGVTYAKEKHECDSLMTRYCIEAQKYGDVIQPESNKLRDITVFLNPAANKRKAKKNFEKYCSPLLYLAGIRVNVVQTQSQGQARSLAEQLDETTDAVVVAGGDGTVSETVTGLLRRENGDNPLSKQIPLGVIPVGQTNTLASALFGSDKKKHVQMMAEATMAIIKEAVKPVDVLEITQLEKEHEDQRPIYSMGGLQWGAFYDAFYKRDKYWFWGVLRSYVSFIFMGFKGNGNGIWWNCDAHLKYSLPCTGCSNCYSVYNSTIKQQNHGRWWQKFVPRKPKTQPGNNSSAADIRQLINNSCIETYELDVSTVNLTLQTANNIHIENLNDEAPYIELSIGPSSVSYLDYVSLGWKYIKEHSFQNVEKMKIKELIIHPVLNTEKKDAERWFYIDSDDYEVKPVGIKLLPKRLCVFYKPENRLV